MKRAGAPGPLAAASLALLGLLALLLLWPLLGGPLPSPLLVAGLLLLRLGLQVLRSRLEGTARRPAAWVLDLGLIGLLWWTAAHPPSR